MRSLRSRCAEWLLLLVPLLAVSVSGATNASQARNCLRDGQFLMSKAACGVPCGVSDHIGCIAHHLDTQVCNISSPVYEYEAYQPYSCPIQRDQLGECGYQCILPTAGSNGDTLLFYITPANESKNVSFSEIDIHQSEQFLTSFSEIELRPSFNNLTIIGGFPRSPLGAIMSTQVNLTLTSTNITSLTIKYLDMSNENEPMVLVRQPEATLESITINDCLLERVPFDGKPHAALKSLDLSSNQIETFLQVYSMQPLENLSLRNNTLADFEAFFPSLKSLDLSGNNLRAIPASIMFSKNLRFLNLSANPLKSSRLTRQQHTFLTQNVSVVVIDGFEEETTQSNCQEIELINTIPVCLDESSTITMETSKLSWYIISLVVATAVLMLVGFSLWYYRRKQRFLVMNTEIDTPISKTPVNNGKGLNEFAIMDDACSVTEGEDSGSNNELTRSAAMLASSTFGSSSLWNDEELLRWQVRYEDVEDVRQIGAGAFAVVWLVKYRDSRLLASKRLVKDQLTRAKTQTFVAEIKLVAQLEHPSIVQFVGVAFTVESDLQALFEYMPNGDLFAYLEQTPLEQRCWNKEKLQIAIDVVEALVYVHSFTPPLLHRDLKSKNILLSEEMKAKLSDFGISRYQSENGTMTSGVGTGKWLAPEVLFGGNDYDHFSDIYSLGVVLCEMDTHALPYAELKMPDVAVLQMVVAGTVRPRLSDNCPEPIRALVGRCLSFESRQRPPAMEIAYILRTFAKTL